MKLDRLVKWVRTHSSCLDFITFASVISFALFAEWMIGISFDSGTHHLLVLVTLHQ
jgi:hypothetical protein